MSSSWSSTQAAAKLDSTPNDDKSIGIDHVERCAAILQAELTMCMNGAGGQAPVLVATGKQAFDWSTGARKDQRIAEVVDKVLGDGARERVVLMDHYTLGNGSNVGRAASLHGAMDKVLNEK